MEEIVKTPNPAASGSGAMAFLFHAGRPGRAVPEQDCSPKFATMRQIIAIAAALLLAGLRLQADDRSYDQRFSEEYAKVGHGHLVSDVSLVDTNNQGPFLGTNALPFFRFRTAGELGGIKLGMTMSEVVAAWGKPRLLYPHCGIGPRLMYGRFASLFFREHRLVLLGLNGPLLAGLVFDNGLKAGLRRPEVEALLGSETPRLAKPADDWERD